MIYINKQRYSRGRSTGVVRLLCILLLRLRILQEVRVSNTRDSIYHSVGVECCCNFLSLTCFQMPTNFAGNVTVLHAETLFMDLGERLEHLVLCTLGKFSRFCLPPFLCLSPPHTRLTCNLRDLWIMSPWSFRPRCPWLLLLGSFCLISKTVLASLGDHLPEFRECVSVSSTRGTRRE